MKDLLQVKLSGLPPTVNHLYRTSRAGVRYKTKAGREWQERTAGILAEAWRPRGTYTGDVALDILFVAANRRRWDIDNRVKALQDCLQMAGIIKDDSQIQSLHVDRQLGEEAATVITLSEKPKTAKRIAQELFDIFAAEVMRA